MPESLRTIHRVEKLGLRSSTISESSTMSAPLSRPLATDRPPTVAQSSVPAASPWTPSGVPANWCHSIVYAFPRFGATSGCFIKTYLTSSSGTPQPMRIFTGPLSAVLSSEPQPTASNASTTAPAIQIFAIRRTLRSRRQGHQTPIPCSGAHPQVRGCSAAPHAAADAQQLAREADTRVDAEPAIDALDVLADRVVAQAEAIGDLAVREAVDDEQRHLALARRQGGDGLE